MTCNNDAIKIPVNLKWESEYKLFSDGTKLGTESLPSPLHPSTVCTGLVYLSFGVWSGPR